jgi:uncharacterized protein YlxW (UPF0749 family)
MKKDNLFTLLLFAAIVSGLVITLNHVAKKNKAECITEIQKQKNINDSLRAELFTMQIQLQRYEYIFDQIQESSSKECKQQLEEILKHTE